MSSLKSLVKTKLPTKRGKFDMYAYQSEFSDFPHIVLISGIINPGEIQTIRIHSECMTGDVFSSLRCDCGEQLDYAMSWFGDHGGILLYMRQEGRGIGIVNKMHAYNLQDEGHNTKVANEMLGFHQDGRNYNEAIEILSDLGVEKVRLMTNNPNKVNGFENSTIQIVERVPIEMQPHEGNEGYLKTKKNEMGHIFNSIKL